MFDLSVIGVVECTHTQIVGAHHHAPPPPCCGVAKRKEKEKRVWKKRARTRKRVWCLLVTLWLIMMVSGLWWLQNGEWLDLGLNKKHREGAKTVVCVWMWQDRKQ